MAHPNEVLIRDAYAAFGCGDLGALQFCFDSDVRWHVPGRSPTAGDYRGAARVVDAIGSLVGLTGGTLRLRVHDVLANDSHAVALLTEYAERDGRRFEGKVTHVIHFQDGTATEVWSQYTDLYSHDEFWA